MNTIYGVPIQPLREVDLSAVRAKLSGHSGPREPQKNLLIFLADGGLRLHVTTDDGYSLGSVKLDNDQIALLGAWLIEASKPDATVVSDGWSRRER